MYKLKLANQKTSFSSTVFRLVGGLVLTTAFYLPILRGIQQSGTQPVVQALLPMMVEHDKNIAVQAFAPIANAIMEVDQILISLQQVEDNANSGYRIGESNSPRVTPERVVAGLIYILLIWESVPATSFMLKWFDLQVSNLLSQAPKLKRSTLGLQMRKFTKKNPEAEVEKSE
jgi:hypothetical protein